MLCIKVPSFILRLSQLTSYVPVWQLCFTNSATSLFFIHNFAIYHVKSKIMLCIAVVNIS